MQKRRKIKGYGIKDYRLRRRTIKKINILRNISVHSAFRPDRQTVESVFNTEVESHNKFDSHIKETAIKLDLPEDVVRGVVTFFLKSILFDFMKGFTKRKRYNLFALFNIEFVNPLLNEYSEYSFEHLKEKKFGRFLSIEKEKIKKIINNLKNQSK